MLEITKKQRQGLITASIFFKLMKQGKTRTGIIRRLRAERDGLPGDERDFKTLAMQHGIENEKRVMDLIMKKRDGVSANNVVYTCEFASKTIKATIGATPDGLTQNNEPIEVKSPFNAKNFNTQSSNPEPAYIWQVKFQVYVLSRYFSDPFLTKGYLVLSHPDTQKLHFTQVEIEEDDIELIEKVLEETELDITGGEKSEVAEFKSDVSKSLANQIGKLIHKAGELPVRITSKNDSRIYNDTAKMAHEAIKAAEKELKEKTAPLNEKIKSVKDIYAKPVAVASKIKEKTFSAVAAWDKAGQEKAAKKGKSVNLSEIAAESGRGGYRRVKTAAILDFELFIKECVRECPPPAKISNLVELDDYLKIVKNRYKAVREGAIRSSAIECGEMQVKTI